MSVTQMLKTIGDSFQSSASVKNVYGEPVTTGDRTVIPVARISYGFGGGGGTGRQPTNERGGHQPTTEGGGGGGGGRMSAIPAGAIEITSSGTRFIQIPDWRKLASIVAVSFALGYVIATRRSH